MRAPAVLLLLASLGLGGCAYTQLGAYDNPSAAIVTIPMDIITSPVQAAKLLKDASRKREYDSAYARMEHDPECVFDPSFRAGQYSHMVFDRWFAEKIKAGNVPYTEAQWGRLLSREVRIGNTFTRTMASDACPPAVLEAAVAWRETSCAGTPQNMVCAFGYFYYDQAKTARKLHPALTSRIAKVCAHENAGMIFRGMEEREVGIVFSDKLKKQPSVVMDPVWFGSRENMKLLSSMMGGKGGAWPEFNAAEIATMLSDDYPWPLGQPGRRELFNALLQQAGWKSKTPAPYPYAELVAYYEKLARRCGVSVDPCPVAGYKIPASQGLYSLLAERCVHEPGVFARVDRIHLRLIANPDEMLEPGWGNRPENRQYMRLFIMSGPMSSGESRTRVKYGEAHLRVLAAEALSNDPVTPEWDDRLILEKKRSVQNNRRNLCGMLIYGTAVPADLKDALTRRHKTGN